MELIVRRSPSRVVIEALQEEELLGQYHLDFDFFTAWDGATIVTDRANAFRKRQGVATAMFLRGQEELERIAQDKCRIVRHEITLSPHALFLGPALSRAGYKGGGASYMKEFVPPVAAVTSSPFEQLKALYFRSRAIFRKE